MDPRAQRVRDALLASAWTLVHDHPLGTLSVALMCRHARVSRQAFYKHFPDLDALVLAAVQESFDAAVDAAADPLDAVITWIRAHGSLERHLYPSPVAEQLAQHLRRVVRPTCEEAVPALLDPRVSRPDAVTLLVGGLVDLLRQVATPPRTAHDAADLRALLHLVARSWEADELPHPDPTS
ncbi:TetR/AcrR family transcriptional regulator [Nocardioides pacificus]